MNPRYFPRPGIGATPLFLLLKRGLEADLVRWAESWEEEGAVRTMPLYVTLSNSLCRGLTRQKNSMLSYSKIFAIFDGGQSKTGLFRLGKTQSVPFLLQPKI